MKQKKALHDEIARVAYEFYETRNMTDGSDLDDWLMAEKIVTEKHERHAKETDREGDVIEKVKKGFRKTDKKGGRVYRD